MLVCHGINYLLKMPSDLDFVDVACPPCRAWLRFKVSRNPFVVPLPMEAGVTCVRIDGVEKKPALNGKLGVVTKGAKEAGRAKQETWKREVTRKVIFSRSAV